MNGTRVADSESGPLKPGEYGRVGGVWHACAPAMTSDGFPLVANLRRHDVVEHEDGTITVSPSILINAGNAGSWHGFLEHGVWREC